MTKTTNCRRCHGLLVSRRTVKAGIGDTCRRRERGEQAAALAAAVADVKPATLAKAHELIEDGGIVPLRGRVFLVVASNGEDVYRTAPYACNCPAGLKGRTCYHQVAARILTARQARIRVLALAA